MSEFTEKIQSLIPDNNLGLVKPKSLRESFEVVKENINEVKVAIAVGSTPLANVTASTVFPATGNIHFFSGPGTFPNAANLTIGSGNIGLIQRIDGVWSKVEALIPGNTLASIFSITNASEAVSAKLINEWLVGYVTPTINHIYGVTDYNNFLNTQQIRPVWLRPKIAYASKLKSFNIKIAGSGSGTLWIKKYRESGDYFVFIEERSFVVTTGQNAISVPTEWKWEIGDIVEVYSDLGFYFTNQNPQWTLYHANIGNTSANVTVANLTLSTYGLLADFNFQEGGELIESKIKSNYDNAIGTDLLTALGISNLINKRLNEYKKPIAEGFVFDRDNHESYYDIDNSILTFNTSVGHVDSSNLRFTKKVGNIINWNKLLTNITTVNWSPTSETATENGFYQFVIPDVTWARLKFPNQHSLQFHEEILDFKYDSISAATTYIGLLDEGMTLYSRKMAHAVMIYMKTGVLSIMEATNIGGSLSVLATTTVSAIKLVLGYEYRLIKRFNGKTIFGILYKKNGNTYEKLGETFYSYGAGANRPAHRTPAILARNIGATITSYKHNSYESENLKMLFIGDSNQSGFGTSDFEKCYPRLAQKYLGNAISVRSANGGTSDDFIACLPEILQRKPLKVFIAIGLNDIRYNVKDYKVKYQSIVSQLTSVGSNVFICKLLPNNSTDVTGFNTWLQTTYGSTHTIIDFYTDFKGADTSLNSAYDSGDGTHPNDLGTALMFEKIKPYL